MEASPVSDHVAEPDLAVAIGGMLADIHRLPVPCLTSRRSACGTPTPTTTSPSSPHVPGYRDTRGRPHSRARAAYQTVRELADQRRQLAWPLIITHRDLGPKNVLLTASRAPVVVDWDVAGHWTAAEEAASAALEWAGVLTGPPHHAAVHALITGYQAAGGALTVSGPEVFAGWLVKNANWTEMHIRHALDDTLPEHRRHAANQAVPQLIEQLERFALEAPWWADWLSS